MGKVEGIGRREIVPCAETLKTPKDQEEFLRNRLWRAFMAGCHAGRELREEDIVHRMMMFLRGRVV